MNQKKKLLFILILLIFSAKFLVLDKISEINNMQNNIDSIFLKCNLISQIDIKKNTKKNISFPINDLSNILKTNSITHTINLSDNSFTIIARNKNSRQVLEIFNSFLEKNPFNLEKLILEAQDKTYNLETVLNY